jgi:hypothetical protein
MKECSLYKRVLQEGIVTKTFSMYSFYKDNKDVTEYLYDVSGLSGLENPVAIMPPVPCIEMKEITESCFEQRKKEILCINKRTSAGVPVRIEDVMSQNETVIPFDSFFIEIGTEHRDESPYKDWSFAAVVHKAHEDEDGIYLMGFSLLSFLPNCRPCLCTIITFNWNKNTQRACLLTPKNYDAPIFNITTESLNLQIVAALQSMCSVLNWLTAKNVKLQAKEWDKKEIKWSKKATGKAITKHYTLVVELPAKSIGNKFTGERNITKALHLVRGHLAHYTQERPLFGRLVGTYYIPAHTRGKETDGIINKNYKFRIKKIS